MRQAEVDWRLVTRLAAEGANGGVGVVVRNSRGFLEGDRKRRSEVGDPKSGKTTR